MNSAIMDPGDLDRLVDLIRDDHPSLANLALEPDGRYQTHPISFHDLNVRVIERLAESLRRHSELNLPMLFCAWGRARVGSTAMANLFGMAGLPSYYQPVKAVLRQVLTGGAPAPWELPSLDEHPHVFIKDVAGPYLAAECLYIPLQLLIAAGYPADRLHLIILDRAPAPALASWYSKWSDRVERGTLLKHFVMATMNAVRVENCAKRHGVPVTHFAYEASKRPVEAAEALFGRLGLLSRFSVEAVTDWRDIAALDDDRARVIFPVEPEVYGVPGLHGSGPEYRYHDRSLELVTDADLEVLMRMGIPQRHHRSLEASARDLCLPWLAEHHAPEAPGTMRPERAQPVPDFPLHS